MKIKTRTKCRGGRAGLTLLEVMVVVIILGMIAGIVTKVVTGRVARARVETAKVQMHEIMDALEFFYQDHHFYPTTEQGLKALVEKPNDERIQNYPENGYLKAVPRDPWGNEFEYVSPGSHGPYDLICYGRDGKEGGEGPDADIKSWNIYGQSGNQSGTE